MDINPDAAYESAMTEWRSSKRLKEEADQAYRRFCQKARAAVAAGVAQKRFCEGTQLSRQRIGQIVNGAEG